MGEHLLDVEGVRGSSPLVSTRMILKTPVFTGVFITFILFAENYDNTFKNLKIDWTQDDGKIINNKKSDEDTAIISRPFLL